MKDQNLAVLFLPEFAFCMKMRTYQKEKQTENPDIYGVSTISGNYEKTGKILRKT